MEGTELSHSLEAFAGDELVFFSNGKWIYPLFELERFLNDSQHRPADLVVVDKVIGKAAAMVLVHLGIGRIHGGMISRLADEFLRNRQVPFTYDELVDRILCRTEELLAAIDDPDDAYRLLSLRANRSIENGHTDADTTDPNRTIHQAVEKEP